MTRPYVASRSDEPLHRRSFDVLVLGGLSALGGITYALFQRDLKRLLAWSTVSQVALTDPPSIRHFAASL